MPKAQDDDLLMNLVDLALSQPPDQREAYLRAACTGDTELFAQVWDYVQWDSHMQRFLLDPLYPTFAGEHRFEKGELLDGRFRIVREVAQGGMGVVYEATDQKLRRRIALKCAKAGFRHRLSPEALHASEIAHPNVCRTYEIHSASTSHGEVEFLTMEFLDGETLTARLRRGRVPQKEARSIAKQICAGLAEAHRNNVVHGDLKSNNVILTRAQDGGVRAVITDFGLARGPVAHTETSGPLHTGSVEQAGTPDYMAPELWKGGKVSAASDVWALGVILHELATGRRPFGGASWNNEDTRKLPPAHSEWDSQLERCLDPDPQKRYRDAGEVAQALEPSRSWRWWLAAAAAVVLAAISGTVTYQRATVPKETVRLAVLTFDADTGTSTMAEHLRLDTEAQIAHLKGSPATKLVVIPLPGATRDNAGTVEDARARLGATHVLRASLANLNDKLSLHAYLIDARTGINRKEWAGDYALPEVAFVPVALAGLVTVTFHLPPLAERAVKATAQNDYAAGKEAMRRDSGVDSAVALFERAVVADPESPITRAGLAEAEWFKYSLSRDLVWLKRAEESLREAELRNPDVAEVHRIAGLLRANSGWYEQAVAEYQRAIVLDPKNGDAYRRLGQVYERNRQLNEALAEYRRSADADPYNYRTYQAIGAFFFEQARYSEAVPYLRKVVSLEPEEAVGHSILGEALIKMGSFQEAQSELNLSLQLHPTWTALHELGLAQRRLGRDEEAIQYFLSALKLSPDSYFSWMSLGDCYHKLNRTAEAEHAYGRGLNLAEAEIGRNPRYGRARSFVAYLCARLKENHRAESEISQALQQAPNDATALWMAAVTYEILGRRDAAISVLSTAPAEVLADLGRLPDVADLSKDPRFIQLRISHSVK